MGRGALIVAFLPLGSDILDSVPQRRNLGGPRVEASERVDLRAEGASESFPAWTLNLSRGGIRLVVEQPIAIGSAFYVTIGEAAPRPARVVWVREEADGQIVGMKFEEAGDTHSPSTVPPPVSGESGSSL